MAIIKRITLLLTVLTGGCFGLDARNISGMVLSDRDSTAVAGALCVLKVDSTIIASGTADANGNFILTTDNKSSANLTVSMTGYNATLVETPSGGKDLNLRAVYLSEGIELGEVTVTGNTMVDTKGRFLVYPSSADVKASPTSISLFQKLALPGLMANPITRSISVDNGNPMILIDGIPSSMDDVNSLQPGDIARIEYSRVTPARYLDKGTNGLINITLKKRDDGGQFYGWMRDCPYIGFFDANIKASYHQGHSQFTLSYAPSWRDYDDVYDVTDRSYIGDDFRVNLHEDGRSPFMYLSNPIKVKYDYVPTSKTTFSATFNASLNKDSRKSDATTFDSELGEYSNNNTSGGHSFSPSLDLFLHHDFNERNSLEAQVVGTLMSSDYRRTNYYHLPGQEEDSYIMDVDTRRRSLISEINYTHIFGQTTAIAAGYQNSLSHSKNTYKTTDYIPTLTENNNYIYIRVEQMIKRVYLSASTGMKLFWIENDMNKRHFIRNLSQFQANWGVSNSFSITGTFTYQPTIPSLSGLTDYPQQISPYLVSNGNPELKVMESFRYTLMPSFNYKKLNLAATVGYIHMSNPASPETRYLGDHLFLTQTVNSNKFRDGWVSLQARLSDIAGFGISAYIGLEHIETGGDGWNHELTSLSGSVNLWWNKGPFTISYWRSFPGKSLWGQMVQRGENGDALSFSYKPNKHWTLEAQWMYMFESGGTYYPSWDYSLTAPSVTKRHIKENGNMVVLSVSYSADFGSLFRSSRRSLNNADSGDALLKL